MSPGDNEEETNSDLKVTSSNYQEALLHVLLLETSCFRYWGQGRWTEYAKEIFRRGEHIINEL